MRKLFLVSVILLVVPGVAYAGGGGVDTSGCAGYTEGTTVSMRDSCFAGTAHFAPSDSAITISNEGSLPHTFTAVDGSFDTGEVSPGASTEVTIDEPGIYRVYCALHGTPAGEGMAGVVVIGEAVPASMSAPLDTTAIQEAVAGESAALVRAIDRQQRAISDLGAAQADLVMAVEEQAEASGLEQSPSPQVITVPSESGTGRVVVNITVGLATGLALAALITALRARRGDTAATRLERLEPSAES
jgi:plastocyanin